MAKVIIEDNESIDVESRKKQNKIGIFISVVAFYVLFKIASEHEVEIIKLKKAIKELKSKGE